MNIHPDVPFSKIYFQYLIYILIDFVFHVGWRKCLCRCSQQEIGGFLSEDSRCVLAVSKESEIGMFLFSEHKKTL